MRRHTAIWVLLIGVWVIGCRSNSTRRPNFTPQTAAPSFARAKSPSTEMPAQAGDIAPAIKHVAFQEFPPPPNSAAEDITPELSGELRLKDYVAEVVARHPSINAMFAAWQAAAQRYPQAIALDDPMFMAMTAPGSLNSATVEGAYALELRQKLPWFGKRGLRGEAASEDAAASAHDIEDARLKIALIAQIAYIEYYLADRQLTLNEQTNELVSQFREMAQSRYQTGQVTQQDVLQADLELAELARRKLELQRMNKVAKARMNTLLLRSPEIGFPKPELDVDGPENLDDGSLLLGSAMQARPDLAAKAHRIEMESAKLALAYKQYYPDTEIFGRYDTFWQPASTQGDLRGQVGVALNLPIYRGKLNAAVCEAQARAQKERAEYEQLSAEIQLEVQTALEQVRESAQAVKLYESRILPTAQQYLAAARSNYEVGKATSLDFIQAQRQLLMSREKQLEAKAMLAQRLVELERALGSSLPRSSL
jgi:outer membrane protein, heavy metal efflux system